MAEDLPPDDFFFDPFSAAEAACEAIVDEVVTEGGRLLYDSYIARKSFDFAATSTCEALVAELMMCYVRHDTGEGQYASKQPSGLEIGRKSPSGVPVRPHSSMEATSASPGPTEQERRPGSAPAPSSPAPDRSDDLAAVPGMDANLDGDLPPPSDEKDDPALGAALSSLKALTEEAVSRLSQEPRAGWELEKEPGRCRIDTWARACVPIRKKLVRPKGSVPITISGIAADDPRKARTGKSSNRSPSRASNASVANSRPASRTGVPTVAEGDLDRTVGTKPSPVTKNQIIPLIDDREEDEEEAMLRELKDREARKVREEQLKVEKKAATELEDAAKLAQVKDDKKNKELTFDSEGNVIFVQQVAVHKLPSTTPAPNFACKQDDHRFEAQDRSPAKPPKANRASQGVAKGKKQAEFKDGFKKFPSQQPAMMDAMVMAPGVGLEERGRRKNGGDKAANEGATTMTRKDYEEMRRSGAAGIGYPGKDTDGAEKVPQSRTNPVGQLNAAPAATRPSDGLPAVQEEQAPQEAAQPASSPRSAGVDAMKIVRSEMGAGLIPHPPATPQRVQPVPPPSVRRAFRRDALGYNLSTRERVQTANGSRFPNCGPQPPLGATMGHGLLPGENKLEEYYYPDAKSIDLGTIMDGLEQATASPKPPIAKKEKGEIVSKNPQLKSRLFGK